jgi:two-component system sensor histidine kinase ResE
MENTAAFNSAPQAPSVVALPVMNVLTHELRSPARVTSSLLNVLSKGYVGELNDRQADLVNRARKRIQVLETLIDDLLDLAAGKADDLADTRRTTVYLGDLIPRIVTRYEALANEKGLAMQVQGLDNDLAFYGDRAELDRILNNLVSNAVKYTQEGSVIIRAEKIDGWIHITVKDSGIGIPADALPRLFQEFFRANNAKASGETGTGLGLAIVKDLVERYDGRINVTSIEGVGTTFCVLLPAAP